MELKEHFKGKIFQLISETADELKLECYVIGGYVRDLFLNRPSKDIDVVVVGSGIEIAEAFVLTSIGQARSDRISMKYPASKNKTRVLRFAEALFFHKYQGREKPLIMALAEAVGYFLKTDSHL